MEQLVDNLVGAEPRPAAWYTVPAADHASRLGPHEPTARGLLQSLARRLSQTEAGSERVARDLRTLARLLTGRDAAAADADFASAFVELAPLVTNLRRTRLELVRRLRALAERLRSAAHAPKWIEEARALLATIAGNLDAEMELIQSAYLDDVGVCD